MASDEGGTAAGFALGVAGFLKVDRVSTNGNAMPEPWASAIGANWTDPQARLRTTHAHGELRAHIIALYHVHPGTIDPYGACGNLAQIEPSSEYTPPTTTGDHELSTNSHKLSRSVTRRA